MPCAETSKRLPGYFDGELDALAAADMEEHLVGCAECRASLEELTALRDVVRRDLKFRPMPPELRSRISAALDREGASGPVDDAPGTGVLPFTPRPAARGGRPFWAGSSRASAPPRSPRAWHSFSS
jgi:anti-sigma factor (TIGR02949 family)